MVITVKDLGPYKSPEERWADTIRLNEELIEWPFTRDIVKGAVRHFGRHHRPLLPYLLDDDEYSEIVVAEPYLRGYRLYDSDDDIDIPSIITHREFALWKGYDLEDFCDQWELTEDELDDEIDHLFVIEALPIDATPHGRTWELLGDYFRPPAVFEFPIGDIGFTEDDAVNVIVEPAVALTFVQIYLDYEEAGIKIVLEDEWLRQQRRKGR